MQSLKDSAIEQHRHRVPNEAPPASVPDSTAAPLAAGYPERVTRLVLVEAVTWPEHRPTEAACGSQATFYGPAHGVVWSLLGLMSRISPRAITRQTLAVFSTHDPADGMKKLGSADVETISHFYRGKSSRLGALNDATHEVRRDLLAAVRQPTLVIHSREDNAVPFAHAEWSLRHIPHARLCASGLTGHFFSVGPDFARVSQRMVEFLQAPA